VSSNLKLRLGIGSGKDEVGDGNLVSVLSCPGEPQNGSSRKPGRPTIKYSVDDQQSQTEQDLSEQFLDQVPEVLLDVIDSAAGAAHTHATKANAIYTKQANMTRKPNGIFAKDTET
jgi:hypothetical protein